MTTEDNGGAMPPVSARKLLERFYYGHSDEVEAILRFAHERRLADDDAVFLLTAILKGNENLVGYILQAIAASDEVVDNSREAGKELRALALRLATYMEQAATRSIAKLNIAADRMSAVALQTENLCAAILAASQDLVRVEGVLGRAVELQDGKSGLDRLIDHIRRQALADIRDHHADLIEELSQSVSREAWAIHAYGVTTLLMILGFVVLTFFLR
ncbi:hypothetical protein ACM61V_16395 [Sphingomonas sp. TX0543]|uniref:hypothetical protein n=1 Tax=unclassified Sphingomonas TaxID=196159 RepID=UPI0010F7E7CD|nr:hypothetical protein [Sphingomonas sp. 3P27F8]